ncbi:MAG: leucyl aminopeptidase family protein [Planctomycetota bacterium]|nr:MAG: leucyl aminopeptidase family protein [Planctomycetota bacterium]
MTKIRFAKDLTAALRGAASVSIVAPHALLKRGIARRLLPPELASLAKAMLADADPGGLGKVVASYTGSKSPTQLAIASLPDRPARHACPSRSDAIVDCAGKLPLKVGKAAVVLCLERSEHYLPAANAIARALPLYDARSGKNKPGTVTVVAVDRKGEAIAADRRVTGTVEATRWAAGLVDRPAAELSPADFVVEARKAVRGLKGVKTSVISGDDLLRKKLGGIHGVGRAAKVPPRLLVLDYRPARKANGTVALVGKGIVYDTGGLNLKTGGHMAGMKCDMGGGAAVAGAFRALAGERCDYRVVALVPLAENAIGPGSYRPDDILHLHSGKTVEINNTDAEGRLLLADGVSWAARQVKADLVVDAATLTGAQLLATGKRHAAVVSNRAGLEELAVRCGYAVGDPCHPLPFAPEFFQPEFKSAVADMRNSVKDRLNAQTSCAAQFVYSHIQELDLPWLHVDLAGPAFPGQRATGYGVALLSELVRELTGKALSR